MVGRNQNRKKIKKDEEKWMTNKKNSFNYHKIWQSYKRAKKIPFNMVHPLSNSFLWSYYYCTLCKFATTKNNQIRF